METSSLSACNTDRPALVIRNPSSSGITKSGLKDVDIAEVGGGIFVLIRIASKRLDFAFELVERRAAVGSRSQYCADSQVELHAKTLDM